MSSTATDDSRPLLALIGGSGSGKSSVIRELHRRRVVAVHPTWTTRPRRLDEVVGSIEHRFVNDGAFDRLETIGFFCDIVTMFGLPYRYGLPARLPPSPGRLDVVIARASLVDRLRTRLPVGLVYQIEDDPERARRRMIQRGSSDADLAARTAELERENQLGRIIADRVFRNDASIDELADRLRAALKTDMHDVCHDPGAAA